MRPHNDFFEDFNDIEEFAYDRTRALRRLRDEHHREDRAGNQNHRRNQFKGRRNHVGWNWDANEELNSYVDDNCKEYYEDSNGRY